VYKDGERRYLTFFLDPFTTSTWVAYLFTNLLTLRMYNFKFFVLVCIIIRQEVRAKDRKGLTMFLLLMSLVVSVLYESILSSNIISPSKEIFVEIFAELISDKGGKLVWRDNNAKSSNETRLSSKALSGSNLVNTFNRSGILNLLDSNTFPYYIDIGYDYWDRRYFTTDLRHAW